MCCKGGSLGELTFSEMGGVESVASPGHIVYKYGDISRAVGFEASAWSLKSPWIGVTFD